MALSLPVSALGSPLPDQGLCLSIPQVQRRFISQGFVHIEFLYAYVIIIPNLQPSLYPSLVVIFLRFSLFGADFISMP